VIEQPVRLGPPTGVPGYRLLSLLEPARPRRIANSPRATLLAVATVCVGAFMGQLDASIVSVALPRMSTDLHASVAAVEWVSLSYVLTLVALVVPIGTWADAVGRKSLYVGGFAVFTAASAACALAPDLAVLCSFRVVQAVGAALMQANSVAIIAAITPRERLGRMVGLQAAAQGIGLALGPALGGALIASGSWRLLFLVNVPAGLIGLATGVMLLPRSRDLAPARRIDPRGVALFVLVIGLTLLAISLASQADRVPLAAGVAVAAALTAAGFVRSQRSTAAPLVPSAVLRATGVRSGLVAAFCGYAVLFGTLVVVPLFLLHVRAAGPGATGLILATLPVGIGLAAPVAGRLSDRAPALVAKVGLLLGVSALAAAAITRPTGGLLVFLLGLVGFGLGSFTPANNRSLMLAAPAGASGSVAGLLNMTRGLGTAAGTALSVLGFTAASGPSGGLTVALVGLVFVGVVGLLTD
jgi:EmrB/QacA subfamily drug resistance transporter